MSASISNELSRKAREIQVDNLMSQVFGYVNTNSYGGAIGNGVTDDTVAFQTSIDYALSQGLTEIYLRGGSTYLIGGALTNTSTLTFIGDSVVISGTTLITPYSLSNSAGLDVTTIQNDVLANTVNINQVELLDSILNNDRYKVTKFDDPVPGDITETIYLKSNNSVYATIVTEFDKPLAGNITETLTCSTLGLSNTLITVFDTPLAGDITETGGTV